MKNEKDIHVLDFCEVLTLLEPMPPITRLYDVWGSEYPSQKAHMVHWFSSQPTKGGGAYSRSKPNESARKAYNRLLNTGGLLRIAEALGEAPEAVRAAQSAAEIVRDFRREAKTFREIIPFDRILELIDNPDGWIFDPTLVPIMAQDAETGEPFVLEDKEEEYRTILEEEFGG